jgi:parvulin-like peptidyl-prolyl isomerase
MSITIKSAFIILIFFYKQILPYNMTTDEITNGALQLKYAAYKSHLDTYAANIKKWNDEYSRVVRRNLEIIIEQAGLPGEVDITADKSGNILDYHFERRQLAIVPAKNGSIGVSILEAQEESDPIVLAPVKYHRPEEFENLYFLRNYVSFLIDTVDECDSQPE